MNVRSSVYWSFALQGLVSAISFANTVVLARLLTPHEFGIFAIALAAQAVMQMFTMFSVTSYVTRHPELTPQVMASAFTVNAAIMVTLAAGMLACSFLARPLLGEAAAGNVLRVLAVATLVNILGFRPSSMLMREMAFKTLSLIGLASVCATVTATLVTAAFFHASYMSAAWGILAGAVIQAIGYNLVGRRHVSLRMSLLDTREIFKFGMRMAILSSSGALTAKLAEIVLGRAQSLTALGLYGRASGITALVQDNIYTNATKICYVKLAEDARRTGDLRPTLLHSLQLIVGLLWPAQIGLAVTAAPVIHIIYGPHWHAAALPLSLLLIAQALTLTFGMNWELFTLRNELSRQTRLELGRTLAGSTLFVIGAQFSLVAAAAARIGEALVGILLYRGEIARLGGTHPGELRRLYLHGAIATTSAVLPALLLMLYWDWSPLVPLELLAVSIGAGIVLWLLALRLLRHPLLDEMMLILGKMRLGARRSTV